MNILNILITNLINNIEKLTPITCPHCGEVNEIAIHISYKQCMKCKTTFDKHYSYLIKKK